jgi:hypothetical protein
MIPADVWEEILGLARGEPREDEAEASESPSVATPDSSVEERGTRPREGSSRRESEPVAVDDGYGRPAGEDRRVAQPVPARQVPRNLPPSPAVPVPHDAPAVAHQTEPSDFEARPGIGEAGGGMPRRVDRPAPRTRLFGDGSRGELRKAVILQEVLGDPLALRKD